MVLHCTLASQAKSLPIDVEFESDTSRTGTLSSTVTRTRSSSEYTKLARNTPHGDYSVRASTICRGKNNNPVFIFVEIQMLGDSHEERILL